MLACPLVILFRRFDARANTTRDLLVDWRAHLDLGLLGQRGPVSIRRPEGGVRRYPLRSSGFGPLAYSARLSGTRYKYRGSASPLVDMYDMIKVVLTS